ncbi:Cfr10I/Bse634I family restriction endonuclease [Pontiella sp.]|uniref:Cfr10I/Bse634I family restriction endonuclease n=1 Tax=Pontiella sp. TaxID=2837462 RepID=UPI003567E7F1
MSYFSETSGGRLQLDKGAAFCGMLSNKLPPRHVPFTELIDGFDAQLRALYPAVTSGSLANAHGDWYEWLLALEGWNYHIAARTRLLPLQIPNVSQFDRARLYQPEPFAIIEQLRTKVKTSAAVSLVTSNPDFVLINARAIDLPPWFGEQIGHLTEESLALLDNAYRELIGRCGLEAIAGYASVKLSLRPDRRLQIAHEGSLTKAVHAHLQTKLKPGTPVDLKYYAVSTKLGDADRRALRTVATHSIASPDHEPEAAVDAVYEVNSLNEATEFFAAILR